MKHTYILHMICQSDQPQVQPCVLSIELIGNTFFHMKSLRNWFFTRKYSILNKLHVRNRLKAGSQYDAGSASTVSIANVEGKVFVKFNSWCQTLDNLIGWTLTDTDKVTLELNLSQFQHHPDDCNAMLVPTSYCELTLRQCKVMNM